MVSWLGFVNAQKFSQRLCQRVIYVTVFALACNEILLLFSYLFTYTLPTTTWRATKNTVLGQSHSKKHSSLGFFSNVHLCLDVYHPLLGGDAIKHDTTALDGTTLSSFAEPSMFSMDVLNLATFSSDLLTAFSMCTPKDPLSARLTTPRYFKVFNSFDSTPSRTKAV